MNLRIQHTGPQIQSGERKPQAFETGVKISNKSTHIDALATGNFPGTRQGLGLQGSQGRHASPTDVGNNLKRAADDLPLDLSAILIAVRKNAQEIRKANVLVRDMGFQAQFDELTKSAGDMKTAANFRLAAGIIQSAVQVGMAGVQLYSSVQAARVAAEGMNPQKEGNALQQEAMNLNAQATQLESQALEARSAPPTAPNDAVNAANDMATTIENDVAARQPTLEDDGWQVLDQEQIQQEIAGGGNAHVDKGAGVPSPEDGPAAAPKTPEDMEKEASVLRKKADDKQAQAKAKFAEVKAINARADAIRSKWDAGSKILDALFGQTSIAGTKFGAEIYDIRSKRHEVNAKQHESQSARANDAIQSAKEIAQDALQKMESIEQARHETNRAIQRNMG